MSSFPNGIEAYSREIDFTIGKKGDLALNNLNERGYRVAVGLTEYMAGAVSVMARQDHIREYCPKDETEARFSSIRSTIKWLKKGGGRAMFLLVSGVENETVLEGYGWTGYEPSDNLPNHPITSAYRIGLRSSGKGLGRDFIQTIVSTTNSYFANGEGIGLETWQGNKAHKMYLDVGFVLVHEAVDLEYRPTLSEPNIGGKTLDRRLYMGYQGEF